MSRQEVSWSEWATRDGSPDFVIKSRSRECPSEEHARGFADALMELGHPVIRTSVLVMVWAKDRPPGSEVAIEPWTPKELAAIEDMLITSPVVDRSSPTARWVATMRRRDEEIARLKAREDAEMAEARRIINADLERIQGMQKRLRPYELLMREIRDGVDQEPIAVVLERELTAHSKGCDDMRLTKPLMDALDRLRKMVE